jgi:3-phenylpropionate/trans-cinnamate dioxygenase ferredoxin reductase subunit
MPAGVVIVGAGQAGYQVAASLRSEGYDGPVALIGEELHLPYQRPPLSKGYLAGKQSLESVALRPAAFFTDHRIDLMLGERVIEIDRVGGQVRLASGARVAYQTLVLAVGASIRRLEIDGIRYLRTLDDSTTLKDRIEQARDIVVIGGGFIGLEVAAVVRSLGRSVAVFEAQPRLMARSVAPVLSEFYRELHVSHGVEISLNHAGGFPPADLVLAGIGVTPNVELASAAGLTIGNGIVVDEHLRTDDPNIYAVGDCAEHPNPFAGGRARIESVQNAVDQARAVAAAIAGRPKPYHAVPWFWTDQFDVRLQMAGISTGWDREVTRGNPESRKFSVFYFKAGRLAGVDSINRPGDHMAGRKLLAVGTMLTPDQAADESVDLKPLSQRV